MKQFTFYKLYSDILDGMNDTDAGKFAMRICEYELEDKLPEEELSGKERFYWSNISDMLAEVKEAESSSKSLKKFNLRSEHFTFYETYMPKITPVEEQPESKEGMTYERFRSAYPDIQGNLYGASERYISDLNWADVAAKFEADEELGKVRNIYYLARNYEQKYGQKRQAKTSGEVV